MGNFKALHSILCQTSVDKDTIILRAFLSPGGQGLNTLLMHASNAAEVAGCIKCCNSGIIYRDDFIEYWKIITII